jgi:hypothetical protein
MTNHYWAVRPKATPMHIRIEQAHSAYRAVCLAFGRPIGVDLWEAKDLGTRVAVLRSDKRRIALLTSPEGWNPVSKD